MKNQSYCSTEMEPCHSFRPMTQPDPAAERSESKNLATSSKIRFNPNIQHTQLECGPMRNIMATLTNIGGALSLFNAAKFG